MTSSSEIFERIKPIIAEHLEIIDESIIKEDSLILEDLGADSLEIMELVILCEEEFGIEIPNEEVDNVESVTDVIALIGSRLEQS
jgi:acyl carrier protein